MLYQIQRLESALGERGRSMERKGERRNESAGFRLYSNYGSASSWKEKKEKTRGGEKGEKGREKEGREKKSYPTVTHCLMKSRMAGGKEKGKPGGREVEGKSRLARILGFIHTRFWGKRGGKKGRPGGEGGGRKEKKGKG